MARTPRSRATWFAHSATAIATISFVLLPHPANAHLSIIRQGSEATCCLNEAGDRHGQALAAGDFNGDGYDDIAMGAPLEDLSGVNDAGAVAIHYGSEHGITHTTSYSLTSANFGYSTETGAQFGLSLHVADFNDDGFEDLVVGEPFRDDAATDSGMAYVYHGSSSGLVAWRVIRQVDVGGFPADYEYFGSSFASGNFDSDPHEDLAIGAPSRDGGGGHVFCLYGTATGPFGGSDLFAPDLIGFLYEVGDHFGFSLASGNVLSDTKDDLVIGAPHRDVFNDASAGMVFVIPGSNGGLDGSSAIGFDASIADHTQQWADFGFSVVTGAFTPGVYEWIAIGEPDRWVGSIERGGRVVAMPGGEGGPNASNVWILTQDLFGDPVEAFDAFGTVLEAGYYEEDTSEDLIVGVPNEDFGGADTGVFHILLGGNGGPGGGGAYIYAQNWLGEFLEPGDELGTSIAIGEFDWTNDGNLAIGAPGEDGDAGLVHIFAPWRQVLGLICRNSIVTDCENEIVFSQKPFEVIAPASTAKILTCLIACERSDPSHPRHVPLSATYTVPDWCADDIGGSQVPLEADEVITLENLIYTCLYRSGNDAAYAIADMLWGSGGPWESVPLFLQEMNDRAQELGMANSHFNSPSGSVDERIGPDFGETFTTAYEMAVLSRAAMENDLFYEVASNTTKGMTRQLPDGPMSVFVHNFFTWVLNDNMVRGSGIKGGKNSVAKKTYCVSAEGRFNRTIATLFGVPVDASGGQNSISLLSLGIDNCVGIEYLPPWEDRFYYINPGIEASIHHGTIISGDGGEPTDRDLQLSLFHSSHERSDTYATIEIGRVSEVEIPPLETAYFGIDPYEWFSTVSIKNEDQGSPVALYIDNGWNAFEVVLDPGQRTGIEFPSNSPLVWEVQNLGEYERDAKLTVEENYGFDVVHPAEIDPSLPVFSTVLRRDSHTLDDGYEMRIQWNQNAQEYTSVIHDPSFVVDVPDPMDDEVGAPGGEILRLGTPTPNPFQGSTSLRLALTQPAEVGVTIYSIDGRVVRVFDPVSLAAGGWSIPWDGQGREGEVAPGIYLYRFEIDGSPVEGGKLVKLE